MVINKYKDIIINNYNEYDEDARLVRDRGHNVEYLTTMRYIQKFLKPGANILEIGAATGRYSIALAEMEYDVTAVDLTPKNVEIMKAKSRNLKNFECMVADALDLSKFADETFDMVLNLGPMYCLIKKISKEPLWKRYELQRKAESVCLHIFRARRLWQVTACAIRVRRGLLKSWTVLVALKIFLKKYLILFILKILKSCLLKQIHNMLQMWRQTAYHILCKNGLSNYLNKIMKLF